MQGYEKVPGYVKVPYWEVEATLSEEAKHQADKELSRGMDEAFGSTYTPIGQQFVSVPSSIRTTHPPIQTEPNYSNYFNNTVPVMYSTSQYGSGIVPGGGLIVNQSGVPNRYNNNYPYTPYGSYTVQNQNNPVYGFVGYAQLKK
jgi:hypothetical protein